MRVIYFVIEPRLKRTIICSFGKFYGRMIVQLDKLKSCQFPVNCKEFGLHLPWLRLKIPLFVNAFI